MLIALYSIRSERQLCEQLDYNLMYRWFLDMNGDDTPFDHSVFNINRERMLAHDVGQRFLNAVRACRGPSARRITRARFLSCRRSDSPCPDRLVVSAVHSEGCCVDSRRFG